MTKTTTKGIFWGILLLFVHLLGTAVTCRASAHEEISLPKNVNEMHCRPGPLTCARLCLDASENLYLDQEPACLDDWRVEEVIRLPDLLKEQDIPQPFQHSNFRCVLYGNESKRQYVLAFPGSELETGRRRNLVEGSLKELIWQTNRKDQKLMLSLLDRVFNRLKKKEKDGAKTYLAATGHGWGGFLAQIFAFVAHDQSAEYCERGFPHHHVTTITFDTIGTRSMLESMAVGANKYGELESLDITNYLSSPNLFNSLYQHVGTLYRVVYDFTPRDSMLQYSLDSHALLQFINSFDPSTGEANRIEAFDGWPTIDEESLSKAAQQLGYTAFEGALNKISLLYRLSMLFYTINKGELLGSYSAFFNVATAENRYDPPLDDWIQKHLTYYDCKYQPRRLSKQRVHERHISKNIRYKLKQLFEGHLHAPPKELSERLPLKWMRRGEGGMYVVSSEAPLGTDMRFLVDILERWPSEMWNPKLSTKAACQLLLQGRKWEGLSQKEQKAIQELAQKNNHLFGRICDLLNKYGPKSTCGEIVKAEYRSFKERWNHFAEQYPNEAKKMDALALMGFTLYPPLLRTVLAISEQEKTRFNHLLYVMLQYGFFYSHEGRVRIDSDFKTLLLRQIKNADPYDNLLIALQELWPKEEREESVIPFLQPHLQSLGEHIIDSNPATKPPAIQSTNPLEVDQTRALLDLMRAATDHYCTYSNDEESLGMKVLSLAKTAHKIACHTFGKKDPTAACALTQQADVFFAQGKLDGARAMYQEALFIQENVQDGWGEAHALGKLARLLDQVGDLKGALATYEKASAIYEVQGVLQSEDLPHRFLSDAAMTFQQIGFLSHAKGSDNGKALDYCKKALTLREKLPRSTSNCQAQAELLYTIGLIYKQQEDYALAIETCEKALNICRQRLLDCDTIERNCYFILFLSHGLQGQHREALDYYEEVAAKDGIPTTDPLDEVKTWHLVGDCYKESAEYDRAVASYQKAETVGEDLLGTAQRWHELGGIYENEGDRYNDLEHTYDALESYKEATEHYRSALTIREDLGEEKANTQQTRHALALCHYQLGNKILWGEESIEHSAKALDLLLQNPNHEELISDVHFNLGYKYSKMENLESAIHHGKACAGIRKKLFEKDHPKRIHASRNLASFYWRAGKRFRAILTRFRH